MNYRRLAASLGVLALGTSLVAIVAPGLLGVDLDRIVVSVVGVLALLQALRVIQRRRHAELDEAGTPDPELPFATPVPGEDLDSVLDGFLDTRRMYYRGNRVREGLRSAAVAVLTRYGGYSEAEAGAALEAGTWTEDRVAAAFLGSGAAPGLPVRARVRNWLRRESPTRRGIRHAVDAIAGVAGFTSGSDGGTPDGIRDRDPRREDGSDAQPSGVTTVETGTEEAASGVLRAPHPTGHWRGASVVALVGIGAGVLVREPAVLLAGVVGVGYAAYARSSALPPGGVSIERSLETDRPDAGEDVEVTVAVENGSDRYLPDLRLVDGVPRSIAVADGSPRLGTALRPGERTTFSYTVTARRGIHRFDPALLVARDLPGAVEEERLLPAETTLTCVPSLRPVTEPVPLREQATQYAGRVETPSGGEGVEFHATREYRSGDPLSRIDWNRRARTGTFTTVEFREERAATIVLVVDARESAYVSPAPHAPHAVDRAVDAAGGLFAALADAGDRVGIAAPGPGDCWLAPGSGVDHRVEARELLATHPALSPVPGERRSLVFRWGDRLRKRLPPGTQILFLTPLCEDSGVRFARRLDEYGHPVTVLSPDPTADRTTGHRLARVARGLRISSLRGTGVPVVDWPREETVDRALARYHERWSG